MLPMRFKQFCLPLLLASGGLMEAQPVEVVEVQSRRLERTTAIPGEILPFQKVVLHARANGFVSRVLVDRGSMVKQGQLLVTLDAPELKAQTAEARSRVEAAQSAKAEAEARLATTEATLARLKKASETAGAIAGLELVQAEKAVEGARASLRSAEAAIRAAEASLEATKQSEAYLNVTAPFAGVITERFVHPGALVGSGNGDAGALVELEQISRLRVVVPVPESLSSGVRVGTRVNFKAPAFPGRTFTGVVARIGRSLDPKTRTMPVELDVSNPRMDLAPGMFPEISWPSTSEGEMLVVPPTSVVTTTERTFVIRVRNGRAEWVDVRKGPALGNGLSVMGPLAVGDLVVRRGTDELRQGAAINSKKTAFQP
jgi:membrane fusion protein, multidrug efflux system